MTIQRLRTFDYAAPGYYLITAVTAARRPILGRITANGIIASNVGNVVTEAWNMLSERRPWLSCVAFTLMPDHVHGVLGWDAMPVNSREKLWHIVGSFKSGATHLARTRRYLFRADLLWQRSFDVRVLQSERRRRIAVRYVEDNWRREWQRFVSAGA